MYLKRLTLTNFKNYSLADLEFSKGINCLVGNNGVGKTNILDAIQYLSLTKSFFNNIDSVSIKHDEDFFIIQGLFVKDMEENNIVCSFHKHKQKVLKINGREYERLSDHIGRYPAVMVSPSDYALVTGGSEERRKFINKIISQYNTGYLDAVLNYNKALQQRNRVLRDFGSSGSFDYEVLSIWDEQLVRYGGYIFSEREKLVNELIPVFQEYYSLVSNGKERVRLKYRSDLGDGDFHEILKNNVSRDRSLEYTAAGIHRDDLIFEMNGHSVRSLGSQGQQKSYLVALKLAKFDYIKRKSGHSPVLLLDDIFDKFDAGRVAQIIRLVGNHRFGQIFITDTHHERLHDILVSLDTDYKLFRIEDSEILEIKGNGNIPQ